MIFYGLDPGASGGIACLGDGDQFVGPPLLKLKNATYHDVAAWFAYTNVDQPYAVIEQVHSMPKDGVSSAFKFGQSYGSLLGILAALAIPHALVTPRKWQSAMGCLSGGDKNVTRAKAQQLFPECKVTHAVADSLLLAAYCRRAWADLF